ncbi:MAG: septum site-determining protein MinC [Pseudomonadota bacterium]
MTAAAALADPETLINYDRPSAPCQSEAPTPASFRFFGRSVLAFVLAPSPPLSDWLSSLDAWIQRSRGALTGRPVVLDLTRLAPSEAGVQDILTTLRERKLRIISIEGVDRHWIPDDLSPLPISGRAVMSAITGRAPEPVAQAEDRAAEPASLVIDRPVRSGEAISFLDGDVTICGSVSSGAEIVAGGSVHVYGTLRGRVVAGAPDNKEARIFCRKFDAELLGIAGYYQIVEDVAPTLLGKPVAARLSNGAFILSPID